MGLYRRPDSPTWWATLEDGTGRRLNTKVPVRGGSAEQDRELRRQALTVYTRAQADSVLAPAAPNTRTLPDIAWPAYSQWYAVHHAAHQRGHIRAASMLRQLDAHFAHVTSLRALTAGDIKQWMTTRAHQVSKSTVNRELDLLKGALHVAVGLHLERSPASDVRRFRKVETEPAVLDYDEEAQLLRAASPTERAWLLMGIDTLLRLGNIVHLQWPQVRLDDRILVPLNAKVSKDTAYITDRLADALRRLPRPARDEDVQWVFPALHRGTGSTAPQNALIYAFARLCAVAGVRHGRAARGVTFHSLRHTGATRALQQGASIKTVMTMGGWHDERMVLRYCHVNDSDVRDAAETIGKRPRRALRLLPKTKTGT